MRSACAGRRTWITATITCIFECGVLTYKSSIIRDMKQDYLDTLKDCREVTLKDCRETPAIVRLMRAILNLFAPML